MMRNILLLIILIMCTSITGGACNKKNNIEDTPRIAHFEFSHIGTIGGDSHVFIVDVNGDSATFKAEGMMYRDFELACELSKEEVDRLNDICMVCKKYNWNGYHGNDRYVLDGSGFELTIKYDDGTRLSAEGMNAEPEGYSDFERPMYDLLRQKVDSMIAERTTKRIAEQGAEELQLIKVSFFNADDDKDSYSFEMNKNSQGEYHIDIEVRSVNEKYFAQGDIKIEEWADKETADIDGLVKILVKHKVAAWRQGDHNAKEKEGMEWLQFDASFDRVRLFTRGTIHPDNYNEFRNDFLLWLRQLTDRIANDRKK